MGGGSFSFKARGYANVSTDYRHADTGTSGWGRSNKDSALDSLAQSVPLSADRCADHAGDMVVSLRIHRDHLGR